ncbi:MAG TPA: thiamine pyrophosphate-dependent dehydrogenase E1 component subunit alpha [Solirubrobacteraceae bacterium]|jgi:pyruvate dehydrogenase E1 component alpha subunit|nr:thiamine pyrophosphate-dependent dehydrogenase E1 component subunit alpha [Solirubrobacteraceae bacterium]
MSSKTAGSRLAADVPVETQLEWLRTMQEIRSFEDECHMMFARGLVRGSTHLCQGQEAVEVGACSALRTTDTMACTYRGHGAVIAKGAPMDRAFGEILGKAEGLCAGKGGSMHLTDMTVGAIGSFAIIGGHLPIVLGTAFAEHYEGRDGVSVCFFGDGSTNIGAFHEALNLAAIWKLPAIFICENNLYGEYSPIANTTPIERLADRAASYGLEGIQIDGQDIGLVHDTVAEAVARARAGDGPVFIEALTYRYKGHSRSDPGLYRPEGELERWMERDPIVLHERALVAAGVDQARCDEIRAEARKNVDEALARAMSWPDPAPESRLEHVFA